MAMNYIIDTANIEEIKRCVEFFPVDGVTTNPTIISKEHDTNFAELLQKIRDVIGPDRMFHVQVTGSSADTIIKEAELLNKCIGGYFYA